MKDKTKKILAGLGLGLVGMGCMTGCSMTEEQQKSLDLVSGKADEIVKLLEDNMEFQNKQLSKEAAYEIIMLSYANFEFGFVDSVQMKVNHKMYNGYFENLEDEYSVRTDYQFKDNVKYLNQYWAEYDSIDRLIADYANDIYLYIEDGEESTFGEDESSMLSLSYVISEYIDINNVKAENIYDVQVSDDGTYTFSIVVDREPYGDSTIYDYKDFYKIEIKDNLIRKLENSSYVTITGKGESYPSIVDSERLTYEFDYDIAMDFGENETIRQEHLPSAN